MFEEVHARKLQSGECFNHGSGMVQMSDLNWRVFDHLIRRVAPSLENSMSPLANCLMGSKDPTV